jgi:organic radical activating enzyme
MAKTVVRQFRKPYQEKGNVGIYGRDDSFRLHWDIITICDYNCAYCYARQQLDWNKISNTDTIDKVIKQLKKIDMPLEVVLLGGEPSISPHYFYILDELHKLPHLASVGSISNANGRVNQEWVDNHNKYPEHYFNFTFHPTEAEPQQFKDAVILAKNNNLVVHIMMIGPKYDAEIRDMIDWCRANDITAKVNVPFMPNKPDKYMAQKDTYKEWIAGYSDTFEKYLYFEYDDGTIEAKNDIDVYLEQANIFTGWSCKNNNWTVTVNTAEIQRMCGGPFDDEWMACPLDACCCQGLMSIEKINTTI